MKKIIQIIIILSTSLLFGKVPAWFVEMPKTTSGLLLEVGYTDSFFNRDRAKKLAVFRAVKKLAKQQQLQMIFDYSTQSDGRFILGVPDFEEIYEESIFNEILYNHIIVDSMITKTRCFYLVQYPATAGITKVKSEKVSWGPKPKWVNKLPKSKNYRYGVGMVANYFRTSRAWQDTDAFARFDTGKNICVNVKNYREEKRTDRYTQLSTYSSQYYDITMWNCKIIKRWYDKKNKAYYSLCRIPQKSFRIN